VQVTAARAGQVRHALPGQPNALTVGRLRLHLQRQPAALGRRHHDLAAEHGRIQRRGHLDPQVVAFPLEQWMRFDADDQVQVAGSRPTQARLAFTGHTDAQTFGRTGRNLDLDGARLAGYRVADLERALRTTEGLLERDLDGLLQIGSFARRAAHSCPTTSGPTKQLLEQAAQVFRVEVEVAGGAWRGGPGVGAPTARSIVGTGRLRLIDLLPVEAPAVVLLALFSIGQDGVRLADLLEQLLGALVARIDVRVVLA